MTRHQPKWKSERSISKRRSGSLQTDSFPARPASRILTTKLLVTAASLFLGTTARIGFTQGIPSQSAADSLLKPYPTIPAAAQTSPAPPGVPASSPNQPDPAPSDPPAAPIVQPAAPQGGLIRGTVKAGPVPLPGVSVTATNTLTGKKYATATDAAGRYALTIPRNGRYVVRAELAAFAAETKEVLIRPASPASTPPPPLPGTPDATTSSSATSSSATPAPAQVAEFTLQLSSRVEQAEARQQTAASGIASALSRGVQSLSVQGDSGSTDASANPVPQGQTALPTLGGLGSGGDTTGESVAVSGQLGQTNSLANISEDDIRQRIGDALQQAGRQGGADGATANAIAGVIGGLLGPGGGGLGGLGFGGGGRGGGGGLGAAFRNFNPAQPHGAIFYVGGNSALNAAPYSITGVQLPKPAYNSNRFGVTFAGSPYIPGLVKADTRQFVFFNLTGQRNLSPVTYFGTVPTTDERAGNFSRSTQTAGASASPVTLFDPATGRPFADSTIPAGRISPQALALLNYYPAPNLPGTGSRYNYQTVTTAGSNAANVSLRYVRNFGKQAGQFGGGFFGGGGRGRNPQGPASLRQNINFNGSYSHLATDTRNIFLPLGGASASDSYGITAGYTVGYGRFTNSASVNWNRSHAFNRNYFTNTAANPGTVTGVLVGNPAEAAQIQANPFFFGAPSLSFQGFTGLSQYGPQDAINQTISFSDFISYSHKRHNMRFGLDLRRVHADTLGGTDVAGSFSFTGYATQNPAAASAVPTPLAPSGSSFADFLLGLPQAATVQASLQKSYLRANVFDYYLQDDWRAFPSLTLNYGLRWEYFAPYTEKTGRLANLDHNADFSLIQPVLAGQGGQFTGSFPQSLIRPDHLLYSPRFGFAYRVKNVKDLVVRGGYGLNFNTGQYASIARLLAFQPPFAVARTNTVTTANIPGTAGCTPSSLTLANAFSCSTVPIQNTFAANPGYRLGHVQIWNLDLQKTFPHGIVTNVGFNGAQGGALDIVRAPNRNAAGTGVLDPNAQPFNFEDSLGYSRFEALSVNVRKRLEKGVSLQATYQYGHSIDNASSIGGSSTVVAQNDRDLNAEEGNSAFDVRHKVTGNWIVELPFGPNRAYLNKGGTLARLFDGFSVSGDYTFASGNYFTPHYNATISETATGTGNSLRPNRDFTQAIHGGGTASNFFNRTAFTAPAPGTFGNASRGSIEGPGTVSINSSISRTVPFGDTRSLEVRATAANVFNTAQYSGIDTTLNSPTFGAVTSTAGQRTLTILARYRF